MSSDWANGANWSGGVAPIWGPVDINTTSPHAPVLGAGIFPGLGTLTVGVTGKGALTVNNGQLWVYDHIFIGRDAGSSGTVSATGANAVINNYGNSPSRLRWQGDFLPQRWSQVLRDIRHIGVQQSGLQRNAEARRSGHGTFYLQNQLHVGAQGTGSLSITNGAIASGSHAALGLAAGAVGTATVDGAGSQWNGYLFAAIGASGTGTLNLTNGGAFYGGYYGINGGGSYIGADATGFGTVNVRGAGSVFETSSLAVGFLGTGFLNITDGGVVRSIVLGGHNGNAFFGQGAGASGTVKIDGAGSLLDANLMIVGLDGTGALAVSNGGTAKANQLLVAYDPGSFGTVNIGAASGSKALAPGLINAPAVEFGAGTGTLVFNHTSKNYEFATPVTGGGSVAVEAGTTILSGANTYTGDTDINGGTLLVTGSTSPAGFVFVNPGGTLGGTGTVGNVLLADFATLAPA